MCSVSWSPNCALVGSCSAHIDNDDVSDVSCCCWDSRLCMNALYSISSCSPSSKAVREGSRSQRGELGISRLVTRLVGGRFGPWTQIHWFQAPASWSLCLRAFLLQPNCGFCLVKYLPPDSSPRKWWPVGVFFLNCVPCITFWDVMIVRDSSGVLTASCVSASAPASSVTNGWWGWWGRDDRWEQKESRNLRDETGLCHKMC